MSYDDGYDDFDQQPVEPQMGDAEADARRLRMETEDFLDQRLGSFEILLDRLMKTVATGRQRLSIGNRPDTDEPQPTDPSGEIQGFFDQDRF